MTCLFSKCTVKCIGHVLSKATRRPSWPAGDSPGAGQRRFIASDGDYVLGTGHGYNLTGRRSGPVKMVEF